jgi:hypothetical protein
MMLILANVYVNALHVQPLGSASFVWLACMNPPALYCHIGIAVSPAAENRHYSGPHLAPVPHAALCTVDPC